VTMKISGPPLQTQSTDNLLALLDVYHFWAVKTINAHATSGRLRRRYECRINHDHHYYFATGRSPLDAVRACIAMVRTGDRPRRGVRAVRQSAPVEADAFGGRRATHLRLVRDEGTSDE